jgi:hypothetical protein
MPLILGTNSIKDTGYDVANSLRFDGSSSNLSRTKGTSDSTKIGTYSWWIKNSKFTGQNLIDCGSAFADSSSIYISSNNTLTVFSRISNSNVLVLETDREFRDPSAWHNIVVAIDTTQSTASNRAKVYVDGVQQTSFSTETYPDQNADLRFFTSSETEKISSTTYESGGFFGGYMCEVVKVDNAQLDATSFGEFDSDSSTIWKPKDVSGLTFGTNGYYLDFEDSSNLGNNVSGGSDFSTSGLAATDQTTDTCTNNFATINPLDNYFAQATLSEGNTKVVTDSSAEAMNTSTFAMTKGKWYMEADFISGAGARMCGITPTVSFQTSSHGKAGDVTPHTVTYIGGGAVQEGNGSGGQTQLASYASYSTGDIIGIYMDLDNMKAYFSKNGTLQSSTGIDLDSLATVNAAYGTGHYMFFVGDNNSGSLTCEANFGNGFQSLSSAVADDNGHGAFEYSPNITGDSEAKKFFACCSKNLAEFG